MKLQMAKRPSDVIHRQVAASVHRLTQEAPAVKVSRIAQDTRNDSRTVLHHLRLMQVTGEVVFLTADHSVVALPERLAKAVRNALFEPWERAGTRELKEIWGNEQDDVFDSL